MTRATTKSTKQIANQRWEDETSARRYAERSDALAGDKKRLWLDIIRELAGEASESETPRRVLDVGTGAGLLAMLYAELGHEVTGLDFSRAMLEQARARAERHGLAVDFVHGDAEALPFESGSFDVVTNRIVLWSLPNPGVAVREWARVLKPGGKLVLFGNHPDVPPPVPLALIRAAFGLWRRASGAPPYQGFSKSFRKQWRVTSEQLPFHHAPAPKIKALFDAAGLKETSIVSLGERLKEEQKFLFWSRTVPWHAVAGKKIAPG